MRTSRKPDPSRGVFETMLVVRGAPIACEAHLARLKTSLETVYEAKLPPRTRQVVAEHAEGLELGRVRLTFIPARGVEVESGEIDRSLHFPEDSIALRSQIASGGLGCHKWVDRAAVPRSGKGEAALLVDGGEVLEADRANVFAVRRGTVFTPPLDGRILPGVTRATMIELARNEGVELVEGALTLEELRQSEEVFLTNSIRGIESVGSVDESSFKEEGLFTHRFEDALRNRWRNEAAARRRPLRTST